MAVALFVCADCVRKTAGAAVFWAYLSIRTSCQFYERPGHVVQCGRLTFVRKTSLIEHNRFK